MTTKQERVDQANELIKIIGSHGRKFFFNKEENRFAKFELRNGRVYFIDDYRSAAIYIDIRGQWRGFSHGGTLRALVLDMREYIVNKTPVPRWKIVIQQLGKSDLTGNIWGYDVESAQTVRDAAYALPICKEKS
jgi:hypothetical protein